MKVIILLLALAVGGCASFPAPQTPEQKVMATYALYLSVDRTADDLLTSHTITPKTANKVLKTLKRVHPMLNAAQQTVTSGGTPTSDTLAVISAIEKQLLDLQAQLQKKQGGH